VTLRAPTLQWKLAARTDGARIEVCTTRDCSTVEQTFDAIGTSGKLPTNLAPGVHYWRALGRSGDTTGCTPSLVWEFFVNRRDATLGIDTSWGTVLDVNEDGYADAVVGAPADSWDATKVHEVDLLLGAPSGLVAAGVIAQATGETALGTAVANAGDVNGDGYADVLVRTANYYDTSTAGGSVDLYLGSASGLSAAAAVSLSGPIGFGFGLASAGDINHDGYADVIVGAGGNFSFYYDTAWVYLGGPSGLSASPSMTLTGPGNGYQSGFAGSVATAGDVNGDGFADVIVGVAASNILFTYEGAQMFHGGPSGIANPPNLWLHGATGIEFGWEVASVGDVDGDGYADVGVAQSAADTVFGAVFIYRGGPSGVVPTPIAELLGATLAYKQRLHFTGADLNGDGYWDVAVGDESNDRVFIYMGGPSGVSTTAAVILDNGADAGMFGCALSGADVDGDGYEDLAVGAQEAPVPAIPAPGGGYLFRGASAGVSNTISQTLSGSAGAQSYGAAVSMSASGS
jgi:hypothetical protein